MNQNMLDQYAKHMIITDYKHRIHWILTASLFIFLSSMVILVILKLFWFIVLPVIAEIIVAHSCRRISRKAVSSINNAVVEYSKVNDRLVAIIKVQHRYFDCEIPENLMRIEENLCLK